MLYQIGKFTDDIIETIYEMMFWSCRFLLIARTLDYVSGLNIPNTEYNCFQHGEVDVPHKVTEPGGFTTQQEQSLIR